MSVAPRIFLDGLASCLNDAAGELRGETDISSSSAFRFLDAMLCCGTANGSINLTIGSDGGATGKNRFLIPIICGKRYENAQAESLRAWFCGRENEDDREGAYQGATMEVERDRIEGGKSGVAPIKQHSLSTGAT